MTRRFSASTLPLGLILAAAALRFYRLAGQSLWADEGSSVALAGRTFAQIARHTAFDIHPPLYYWLLKIWVTMFGSSEIGLRSLSAGLGVGLMWLIWALGARLFNRRVGLIAAFLAAVSPLQVYYAQEARMYMLLAVLGALTALAAAQLIDSPRPGAARFWPALLYVVTVTAGLYTHYAYPVILAAVNLAALLAFVQTAAKRGKWQMADCKWQNLKLNTQHSKLFLWLGLQIIPVLLYAPWLPTAWRQLTTWPSEKQAAALPEILATISNTVLFGLAWPYSTGLLGLGLLAVLIAAALFWGYTQVKSTKNTALFTAGLLLAWLLFPIGLTAFIFSPAFLKFLLVAAPPLALLIAILVDQLAGAARPPARLALAGGLLLAFTGASALALYHYYDTPRFARDNYRGLVQFIKAVSGPNDAIILNAEGQQDVFNYYFSRPPAVPVPVYPLPRQRPLDEAATLAQLEAITAPVNKVYAVYWANRQADPAGLIESWLNNHLYKAADSWYGNVRLVSYASPQASVALTPVDIRLGPHIRLTGYGLAAPQVAPGDILQVALRWQTAAPLADEYTVFVQMLDPANHLVGQRDAPPLTSSTAWPVGQPVDDRHGLFIEPGTPPGPHRLVAGLYHRATGQRLPINSGIDFIELGMVEIVRPAVLLPPEAFTFQTPLKTPLGGVTLLGYDLHKLGYRSAPDMPLHPGDPLHLTLIWQAGEAGQTADNQLRIAVESTGGKDTGIALEAVPAGVDYPVWAWQPGEIVRGQFNLFLTGIEPGAYRLALELGGQQVETRSFKVE